MDLPLCIYSELLSFSRSFSADIDGFTNLDAQAFFAPWRSAV